MWKLKEIYAQNICAFRELNYSVHQHVTTLVFGDNRDNESQRSNGSGKSALIECIALGLTGSPLRKIKNEEIINDSSEECFVELTLMNESLREVFIIERRLFRKGSALVKCRIERNGRPVDTDEAVQSSVDSYNRYILEKLGVSKEELFNTFLLSKHKYQNFLSCSDKEKKEIINRFSNAIVVDEAIGQIREDKTPFENRLKEYDLSIAENDGRIKVFTEQIEDAESELESRKRTRQENIQRIKGLVASKKVALEQLRNEKDFTGELKRIQEVDKELQEIENGDPEIGRVLECVPVLLLPYGEMTNWRELLQKKEKEIESENEKLVQLCNDLERERKELNDLTDNLNLASVKYEETKQKYEEDCKNLQDEEEGLREELRQAEHKVAVLKNKRRAMDVVIEDMKNRLAGAITCPKCTHLFIIAQEGFDSKKVQEELKERETVLDETIRELDEARKSSEGIEQGLSCIQKKRLLLGTHSNEWGFRVTDARQKVNDKTVVVNRIEQQIRVSNDTILSYQEEISHYSRKIFDEAFGLIDQAYRNLEQNKKAHQEETATIQSSIGALESNLEELERSSDEEMLHKLKDSLKEWRIESGNLHDKRKMIEKELIRLKEQEENFTAFKTYLANSKIEALSKITNEFLENIGSDIRISFSGYTFLRSGKIREKISVSLVRGGVDCGSFGKFSAGEAARVNLATILAMQKLVNTNCEDGKGLDLLILDEILEAVDEQGLAMMFDALNKIGVTSLIVSHGNIAEAYPYVLKIIKEHGESRIG